MRLCDFKITIIAPFPLNWNIAKIPRIILLTQIPPVEGKKILILCLTFGSGFLRTPFIFQNYETGIISCKKMIKKIIKKIIKKFIKNLILDKN